MAAHPTLVFLNARKDKVLSAVPTTFRASLTWERIMQAVGAAIAKSDRLADCSPDSVYRSLLEIVGKGLDLGMDGQAYLVPFKGECTPIIGAQGKIELAYRSGMIDKIVCQVVYEGDDFDLDLANGTVSHPMRKEYLIRIAEDSNARGQMIAAYARIWVKGVAEPMLELMTSGEFERIKADSAKRNNGKLSPAYQAWPSEMFRRSCLNPALKRAPKSRDLMEVLNREMQMEEGEAPPLNVIDADAAPAKASAAPALPDHGEPEDVEAELNKIKDREKAAAKPAAVASNNDHPWAGDDGEVMP